MTSFKTSAKCVSTAGKANKAAYRLRRHVDSRNSAPFLALRKAFLRTHSGCAVQARYPHLIRDNVLLEHCWPNCTEITSGLKVMPYEDRLRVMSLTILGSKRIQMEPADTLEPSRGTKPLFFLESNPFLGGHNSELRETRQPHMPKQPPSFTKRPMHKANCWMKWSWLQPQLI